MSTIFDPVVLNPEPVAADRPTAVHLYQVNKSFRLPHQGHHSLRTRAAHGFRSPGFDVLQAVNDVSVDIGQGEFFGIVGRNGSGKSTLLKCLAGVYRIDHGEMGFRGRLAPFIELGVGFNPELTARDNAIVNAIMLGLSRREAEVRLDAIVEFAELEEFMDLKLKNYSSGMFVRLAFSVAIQVDADILLIDEVLAVGDANFQQKCFDEFSRLKAAGKTIILVTHDMAAVERFCERAMLLDHGNVIDIAAPSAITRQYNDMNFGRAGDGIEMDIGDASHRGPVAEVLSAGFRDPDGHPTDSAMSGDRCHVLMEVHFHQDVEDPLFGIGLRNQAGHPVVAVNSSFTYGPSGAFRAGETVTVKVEFENWLAAGRYTLDAAVARNGFGAAEYDRREATAVIEISSMRSGGGAVDLPHSFDITLR
jgi:ABC-type polysaccharide/polyol phosphate transport system ATPase subunit